MARLTIKDCLKNVKDKYELIVLAGQRSRQLYAGKIATIESKDRVPVVSLREIAKNTIDIALLEKNLIKSFLNSVTELYSLIFLGCNWYASQKSVRAFSQLEK